MEFNPKDQAFFINRLIKKVGSPENLAYVVGVRRETVWRWRNGKTQIQPPHARKIAAHFGNGDEMIGVKLLTKEEVQKVAADLALMSIDSLMQSLETFKNMPTCLHLTKQEIKKRVKKPAKRKKNIEITQQH